MKIILTLLTFLLAVTTLIAQDSPGNDRVKAAKVQFFNERLELTPGESKKFWPVYNDYISRKSLLTKERRNLMSFYKENQQNMSPLEISQSLNRYIEIEKQEAQLLEIFNEKFKEVLPDEKVIRIYITEIDFRNYLLKQLRTRQQSMKPRN